MTGIENDLPLEVGDMLFQRAVAQGKVRLRQHWLAATQALPGQYTVRYVGGGVEMRRIA